MRFAPFKSLKFWLVRPVASQTHRHQKLSYGLSQLEKYGLKLRVNFSPTKSLEAPS